MVSPFLQPTKLWLVDCLTIRLRQPSIGFRGLKPSWGHHANSTQLVVTGSNMPDLYRVSAMIHSVFVNVTVKILCFPYQSWRAPTQLLVPQRSGLMLPYIQISNRDQWYWICKWYRNRCRYIPCPFLDSVKQNYFLYRQLTNKVTTQTHIYNVYSCTYKHWELV